VDTKAGAVEEIEGKRGERPSHTPGAESLRYGSDYVVELLNELEIEFVSINPGASLRGLHDSLVNHGDRGAPQLILCAHEEIAVAIAHGYAKASGKVMASMIHNIVGLQHASMAIFNAWVDRVPMLLIGGGGPMDAAHRRPRIDWNHTALVQGNLIRDYVKWDDQPTSLTATAEAMIRGYIITRTAPQGPVYVCIDTDLQETEVEPDLTVPDVSSYTAPSPVQAPSRLIDEVVSSLLAAANPVLVVDHMGRNETAVPLLSELADLLALPVIDVGNRFNIPTTHPMNITGAEDEFLPKSDLLLALDVKDLYGAITVTDRSTRASTVVLRADAKVITVGLDHYLTSGFVADYQRLHPVTVNISADTGEFLPELLRRLKAEVGRAQEGSRVIEARRQHVSSQHKRRRSAWLSHAKAHSDDEPIAVSRLAADLWSVMKDEDWVLTNGTLADWVKRLWKIEHPRQYLGPSGGGGLGYGLGASLGAALAHKTTGKICINLQGDGDFMYTPNALWTAAHHKIPLLTVLFNNRSYYTDEIHQELVAKARGRPEANKKVGIRLEDPFIDYASMASAMGVKGFGPITTPEALLPALREARDYVKTKRLPVLVDVVTQPR